MNARMPALVIIGLVACASQDRDGVGPGAAGKTPAAQPRPDAAVGPTYAGTISMSDRKAQLTDEFGRRVAGPDSPKLETELRSRFAARSSAMPGSTLQSVGCKTGLCMLSIELASMSQQNRIVGPGGAFNDLCHHQSGFWNDHEEILPGANRLTLFCWTNGS